jgi:hypothetical protein
MLKYNSLVGIFIAATAAAFTMIFYGIYTDTSLSELEQVIVVWAVLLFIFLYMYFGYGAGYRSDLKKLQNKLNAADAAIEEATYEALAEYRGLTFTNDKYRGRIFYIVPDSSSWDSWKHDAIQTIATFTLYPEQFIDGVTTQAPSGTYYHFESRSVVDVGNGVYAVSEKDLIDIDFSKI